MPLPRLTALALVLVPATALAGGFEAAAAKAQRLERLDPFLEKFVGRCTDPYTRRECESGVAAFRKEAGARTFVVKMGEVTSLVRPERDASGEGYVLLLTPFFDGGGLALTSGTPTKQDAAGNPLVPLVPVPGTVPPGTMEFEFLSPFRTGAVEIEVVFKPVKVWKLPRKGGGSFEGVGAKLVAVRILDGRTGNELGSKVL
jgi:hypothetical protein